MKEECRSPAAAEAMAGKAEQARGWRSVCRAIALATADVGFVADLETADPMFLPNETIFLPQLSRSRRLIPSLPAIAASAVAEAAMADEAATASQSQSNQSVWSYCRTNFM